MKKLVLLVMVLVLLAGCNSGNRGKSPNDYGQKVSRENAPAYTLFYIEKMPCVWMEYALETDTRYARGFAGLSCDWSKWTESRE